MTHKAALFLALASAVALPACSVDAPTRDNFDYSFQEEMPEDLGFELGFSAAAVDSELQIRFRDSAHGTDEVNDKVAAVPVIIESVMVERITSGGDPVWHTIRSTPIEVDLYALAGGDLERIAGGPLPAGHYSAVAIELSEDNAVVDTEGTAHELKMPESVLMIETEYGLANGEVTELLITFGGLRSLEAGDGTWYSDPNVTIATMP